MQEQSAARFGPEKLALAVRSESLALLELAVLELADPQLSLPELAVLALSFPESAVLEISLPESSVLELSLPESAALELAALELAAPGTTGARDRPGWAAAQKQAAQRSLARLRLEFAPQQLS